jgi:perosamine synthetase
MNIINLEPWINSLESDHIGKVVKKTFLTENIETYKFESSIKKRFNSKVAISVTNWTAGLFIILKSLNLKKNDEVIIPNLTFIATSNAVIFAGCKLVLCDIDPNNLCLDLKKLKKLISKKTKCIIPVHLYGHCCDMDELKKISKKKIIIVEDAAQAIGAKYKKKFLGTIGDFGGFSFYGNKIITTGEGGVILTNKVNYKNKLYSLKNHGRIKKGIFVHNEIGFNFMFTELQAAIGNIQLKKLNKIISKKKKIFLRYYKNLEGVGDIKFMKPLNSNKPVYWFSNIFTTNKNKLKKFLENKNIQIRDFFLPLNMQPCYKKKRKLIKNINNSFPVSQKAYNTGLSLPSSYSLTLKEIDYICNNIKNFFNNKTYKD